MTIEAVIKEEYLEMQDRLLKISSIVDEFTRLYDHDDDRFAAAIIFQIRDVIRGSASKAKSESDG